MRLELGRTERKGLNGPGKKCERLEQRRAKRLKGCVGQMKVELYIWGKTSMVC